MNNKQQLTINKEEIYNNLEKDVLMLNNLFSELNFIIKEQGEELNSIEDNITISKQDTQIALVDIIESNKIVHSGVFANITNLKFGSIGAGLGAIAFIYNPYIAIPIMMIGGIIGWNIGDKLNSNSLEQQINKND